MRRDALLLAALAAAAGCDRGPPPAVAPAPAAPAITVVRPEMRPIRRVVEQPGAVQAFEETALFAKLPGYVGAVAADPDKRDRPPHDRAIDIGSRVRKGQVLADLSIPELDKEFDQKQAVIRQAAAEVVQADKALVAAGEGVAAARAAVAEAEAGVARAKAGYDRWESEAGRVGGMVKGGTLDAQTGDETRFQFRAAAAGRDEAVARVGSAAAAAKKAEADRGKATADVDAARARLDVAKADAGRVDALRGYTRIAAPFDGVVTRRGVSAGDFVTPDQKAALFRVARIDPVRVVVQVPEADAGLVAVGQEVAVTLQAVAGPPAAGKVARTSWSLEPGSRTLRVEVDLPNPDGRVRPGMYVYARLTAELLAGWAVPAAAVGKVGDEAVVYLAEGGKAVRAMAQLGRGDGQFTQVRRVKRPGSADWVDVTGTEAFVAPAAALADGQPLP